MQMLSKGIMTRSGRSCPRGSISSLQTGMDTVVFLAFYSLCRSSCEHPSMNIVAFTVIAFRQSRPKQAILQHCKALTDSCNCRSEAQALLKCQCTSEEAALRLGPYAGVVVITDGASGSCVCAMGSLQVRQYV